MGNIFVLAIIELPCCQDFIKPLQQGNPVFHHQEILPYCRNAGATQ